MKPIMIVVSLVLLTYFAVNYDYEIFSAARSVQNPVLDAVMLVITNIATLYIGVPVIAVLIYFSRQRKILWDLGTALVIGIIIVWLLKVLIARPRPEDILNISFWASAEFTSFPSDHAATAFLMFGVIGHYLRNWKNRLYLLAILIGVSRIYLGVHYPTDVLAGAFIGILVSQLVMKYRLGSRLKKALKRK
jgi:undecaprenyl-diphosphatase